MSVTSCPNMAQNQQAIDGACENDGVAKPTLGKSAQIRREERIAEYRRRQPIAELRRKAEKACERANLWSQEELDLANAEAKEMADFFASIARPQSEAER